MNRAVTILVTGFGPYPRVRVNPTAALARALGASRRPGLLGFRIVSRVFETSYGAAGAAIGPMLAEIQPDACLHLGLAPRAKAVRVEMRGENRTRSLAVDVRGNRPRSRALVPEAPSALRSTAPVRCIRALLADEPFRARLSNDAGAYLCNAVYYWSLLESARSAGGRRPVVFLHIPWPAARAGRVPLGRSRRLRPTASQLAKALMQVAALLAAEARRG
jgi:pyroglutamyl-peptidase